MRFLSVCSGIEAASVAWNPLGWKAVGFSEIEPFPCAVLAHHYPGTPNYGDMTKFEEWPNANVDLLCGGTPCQSFSVAGLRKGLADPRGNLMLTFGAIAAKYRPRWLVWENVPGVLSSNGGRDFGAFLGMLGQLGYGFAYRVLDAQYFGVPQRRRRVFVVGCLGDWRRAASVLFERHSMSGHPAPSRESGKVAPTIPSRSTGGGGLGTDFDCDGGLIAKQWPASVSSTLDTTFGTKQGLEDQHVNAGCPLFVPGYTHALRGEGFDASEDGTGRGTPLVPVAFSCKDYGADAGEIAPTLRSMGHDKSHANAGGQVAIAFNARQDPDHWHDRSGPLDTDGGTQAVAFDATQITSAVNRSNPKPGDPCHPLAAGAHPPAVCFAQGEYRASAQETNASQTLRAVREAVGAQTFAEWGLGILDSLQQSEVLRQVVHGKGIRLPAFSRSWVVCCTLGSPFSCSQGAVQSLREAAGEGCASQGWQPSEQLAGELGAYLSELSQPGAQAERLMRDLWQADEGSGLLRETLSAFQEARRSADSENKPAHASLQVRRLTTHECAFLQGFPRNYLDIPYRGKPAADGPKYKALGNSWAVPVVRWIGERIQEAV